MSKIATVICSRTVNRIEPKLGGMYRGNTEDLELLKWFRPYVQDGYNGSHLEIL